MKILSSIRKMPPTQTLQFLTLVLIFFTNGQSINARELKTELQDHKHVNSNDEPYITQYGGTKPNQEASYTTTKHNNHISHLEKLIEIKAYEESQPNYIVGYRTNTHGSNEPYVTAYGKHEAKQSDYIVGYKTHTSDSNKPYITSYGKREVKQPDYIIGYKTNTHDSNEPYITAYGKHEAKQSDYIVGYRTHTPDSNEPYITSYGKREAKQPDYITGYETNTHDSNEPYTTYYGKHEAKQPDYITEYRTNTHDSNEPYIIAYGKHESKQPDYITGYRIHTHGSNEPYATSYSKHEDRVHTQDSNEPYITASYGKNKAKQSDYIAEYRMHTHDSNEPYITASYGKNDAQKLNYIVGYRTHAHDSNEPYITTYNSHESKQSDYITGYIGYTSAALDPKGPPSTNSENLEGPPSSNLDRREAFKVGFFNLDDLYVGNVMTLQFPTQEVSNFLSRKEADSIPFSISQLPSALQLLSIPEDSPEANSMRGTIEQCEGEGITGETKLCASSQESMLEFVDKIIGSDTKHSILSTSKPSPSAIPLQKYTILKVSDDINAPKWVACHPLPYPYAIHYCHYISTGTKVFKVTLIGDENGDKMEALGICHLDTSDWNPDHIIFKQLRIKPGKNSPVCHFFPVNHLLWVPLQPSKTTM
ncbi:uncharacterized protein [Cicer arietinum]|uniref:BURP domain-containing protein 9 n=1 Tax=Cicer arietinum TaxID=3827 RepID=A0A1S2YNG6_CICAR|nr:BURP domain-containing protein 9 [Cicer arietinum]